MPDTIFIAVRAAATVQAVFSNERDGFERCGWEVSSLEVGRKAVAKARLCALPRRLAAHADVEDAARPRVRVARGRVRCGNEELRRVDPRDGGRRHLDADIRERDAAQVSESAAPERLACPGFGASAATQRDHPLKLALRRGICRSWRVQDAGANQREVRRGLRALYPVFRRASASPESCRFGPACDSGGAYPERMLTPLPLHVARPSQRLHDSYSPVLYVSECFPQPPIKVLDTLVHRGSDVSTAL